MEIVGIVIVMAMCIMVGLVAIWLSKDGRTREGIGGFERIIAFWLFIFAALGFFAAAMLLLVTLVGVPLEVSQ